ncbi:hypothetical protein F5Y08DRAFT_348238 [Xylaria arbuscula]|nr:hypothetical protein F5Y08DRAFT_348238 [Xylaria arbuscula]
MEGTDPPKPASRRCTHYLSTGSAFNGQNTYLCYQSCQKRFATWLARTLVEIDEEDAIAGYRSAGKIIPFNEVCRFVAVIKNRGEVKEREMIPQRVINMVRFMSSVLEASKISPSAANTNEFEEAAACMSGSEKVLEHIKPAPDDDELVEEAWSLPTFKNEAFFAWRLFFNDLGVIKSYLETLPEGLSLIASGLVINTAIRLIRANCEAQIRATVHLPNMPDEYNIIEWMFKLSNSYLQDNSVKNPYWNNMANWCCHEAQRFFTTHTKNLRKSSGPDCCQVPTPLLAWEAINGEVSAFAMILRAFMHNVSILGWNPDQPILLPCLDELTSGWAQMEADDIEYLKSGKILLWIAVTIQIYTEICLHVDSRYVSSSSRLQIQENRYLLGIRESRNLYKSRMEILNALLKEVEPEDSLVMKVQRGRDYVHFADSKDNAKGLWEKTLLRRRSADAFSCYFSPNAPLRSMRLCHRKSPSAKSLRRLIRRSMKYPDSFSRSYYVRDLGLEDGRTMNVKGVLREVEKARLREEDFLRISWTAVNSSCQLLFLRLKRKCHEEYLKMSTNLPGSNGSPDAPYPVKYPKGSEKSSHDHVEWSNMILAALFINSQHIQQCDKPEKWLELFGELEDSPVLDDLRDGIVGLVKKLWISPAMAAGVFRGFIKDKDAAMIKRDILDKPRRHCSRRLFLVISK